MKYQKYLDPKHRSKWLALEVTLGTNETIIARDLRAFTIFLKEFDTSQRATFKKITGIAVIDTFEFSIADKNTLQILMLKKFIEGIALSVIQEARPGIGDNEHEIFLNLLVDLIHEVKYPDDIYAYAIYRKRGTPTTWLNISDEYDSTEIETTVKEVIGKIVRSINYYLPLNRRLVSNIKVNELVIFLLSKPTSARVLRGENRNIEVPGASYSIVVLDVNNKRIGIVSGSNKEIQVVHRYLRHKVFKDALAPPRNDQKVDGKEILKKIVKPSEPGILRIQSMELKRTALPENPSLKIQVQGHKDIDEALDNLSEYWKDSSISDLKQAEFLMPIDRIEAFRKIGIYTYGDEWRRTCINTSTKNIPSLLEEHFLEQIRVRLDGIDIKDSRFVLEDLGLKFIINKLLVDKSISTNPPIPEEVEHVVVSLTRSRLITKQESSIKRKCWNCYRTSWDSWGCPSCGRQNMRIVSEALRITPNEASIVKAISLLPNLLGRYAIKYHPHKQRNRHKKNVVSLFHVEKNITTFVVMVSNKQDVNYVESLSGEGFGIVAVIDPKMEGKREEVRNAGSTVVNLTDVVVHLLDPESYDPLQEAIALQEDQMLQRIFTNTLNSVVSLKDKNAYTESRFEIDIKNLMQALVPDVIRLGTEFTGKSVPDGYSRYGTDGKRSSNYGRRLFGWDAKYSQTSSYSLTEGDVRKQKKYIDWLLNPEADPARFGKLGIYAIIANFDNPRRMNNALVKIAEYRNLKRGIRVVLIEDMLLVKICEWLLANWQQVLENNSKIADEVFKWFRRKQTKPYSISRVDDWSRLEQKLNAVL